MAPGPVREGAAVVGEEGFSGVSACEGEDEEIAAWMFLRQRCDCVDLVIDADAICRQRRSFWLSLRCR